MDERGTRMPWLHLVSEYDLDFATVLLTVEKRYNHFVDRQRDLLAVRAHVVHCIPISED